MRKKISFKGVELSYTDRGLGPCICLLHGYLETAEIWEDFAPLLTDRFRVIAMDLPGHGWSGSWGDEHSMNDLATALENILDGEGIEKIILVGHSMGGYVAMAFATLFPERLAGYVLFHSTCFADSPEKKTNRDREISLVLCDRKRQIINVNIPKAFADDHIERFKEKVKRAQEIAYQNDDQGIVALIRGMKNRADLSSTLSDPSLPLLLIGGMKDNYIPPEVFEKLAAMAAHAFVLRLRESGHMGFMEEPGICAEALIEFATKVSRPAQNL
jgi:pimeloyl-ACP methyl ester carboxylesterase